MHPRVCLHFVIVLLLGVCCSSSPVSYADQAEQEPAAYIDEQDLVKAVLSSKAHRLEYLKVMCALYGDCHPKDHDEATDVDMKHKRLSSNLFHGIPKFGKRAFTSAFSGIPKFG